MPVPPDRSPPSDMHRLLLAALLASPLLLAACASTAPPSSAADWASLADILSAEEYTELFLEVLDDRLEDVGAPLADDQHEAVYQTLYRGSEAQRQLLTRFRDAGPEQTAEAARLLGAESARTDAVVEGVLTPVQVPVYRQLQVEARALLLREAARE